MDRMDDRSEIPDAGCCISPQISRPRSEISTPPSSPPGPGEEFHDTAGTSDREEGRGQQEVVLPPTGSEPFLWAIRHWTAQIVFAILALGGWHFWTRLGGVSSLYFSMMAGYLLFFLVVGFLVFQRGVRRRLTGEPWRPPLKGTWMDEFKSLAVVFVASFAVGGVGWFLSLQMPSRNLGRLDVVRRHVYSFGPELQSLEDGAGNRYTIRNLIEMSPRLHKYGPDGRLRWAISLETYRGIDPVLSIDADGSLVVRMDSHVERYDSDGWEIVAPEATRAAPDEDSKGGSENPRHPRNP